MSKISEVNNLQRTAADLQLDHASNDKAPYNLNGLQAQSFQAKEFKQFLEQFARISHGQSEAIFLVVICSIFMGFSWTISVPVILFFIAY